LKRPHAREFIEDFLNDLLAQVLGQVDLRLHIGFLNLLFQVVLAPGGRHGFTFQGAVDIRSQISFEFQQIGGGQP
jgi:hypothetical protein